MKKGFLCLGIFAAFLVASCIEDLSVIPIKAKKHVVAFCVLNEGPVQSLKLYYTGDNGMPGNQPVEGAKAWLCSQDTTIAFDWIEGMEWRCNYQPFYGERIELKILPPDQDTLRSVTVFPKDFEVVGRISSIKVKNNDDPEDTTRTFISYELYNSNKYNKRTYYLDPITWSCCLWFVPGNNKGYPSGEYLATNHIGVDDFNVCPGAITDLPCFNPESINTSFSDYKNGLLFVSECLPNLKLHYKVLRIKHSENYSHPPKNEEENYYEAFSSNSFLLLSESYYQHFTPLVINGQYKYPDYMYVYSVSDEYDAYLKKTYEKFLDTGNLVSNMYDTDASYSNIYGGRGIFGSCIVRIVPSKPCMDNHPGWYYYPFPINN